MLLKEVLAHSWESLQRNRLRSGLTMLGIVWGLATVVLLLGYGQSVGESVVGAFMGIGNNVIMIWQGQTSMQAGGQRSGRRILFKYDDLQAIRDEAPLVKNVSAEYDDNFAYKYGNRVVSVSTKCVQFPYGEMRKLKVGEGRYFEENDFTEHRRVLIFGPNAAKKVFGGRPPLGEYVAFNGAQFQVIGVLELKIQDSSNNGPDNENVFVPFESAGDVVDLRDPPMIVFQPVSPDLHLEALSQVRGVLGKRHGFNPKDDKAAPEWDTVADSQEIQKFSFALQVLLGFIGALSQDRAGRCCDFELVKGHR